MARRAELFSVVEPMVQFDEVMAASDIDVLNTLTRESRDAALLAQRDRTHPGMHDWPFTIETGDRVERIVATAEASGASVIILGLGAHGLTARLLQRETAVRVMRASPSPSWPCLTMRGRPAQCPGGDRLHRIEWTAQRGPHSGLLGTEGRLYLAHVTPRIPMPLADSRQWDDLTGAGVLSRLSVLAKRLAPPPGVEIEFGRCTGNRLTSCWRSPTSVTLTSLPPARTANRLSSGSCSGACRRRWSVPRGALCSSRPRTGRRRRRLTSTGATPSIQRPISRAL